MSDTLDRLIEDGVIDGVRSRLMSGKEASVFIVERQGELLAAKVYKAREQRTFKATASYTEGRNQTRNSRDKRAMNKRSSYGRELMEESWRDVEVRALNSAFHAGVRVPKPFMLHDDVLLMELLVDEDGAPAPRLADFELPRETAERLHREIYDQVRLLLSCGHIHGDLSAFNILMARGGPTLIDMPQVVDAARNNQAREILRRDLRNITEHLARYDARLLRFRDCGDALWQHYVRGTLDAATEPQEGSVGGGHHRSRRTRDADRGRMGRERQDGSGARQDGPPRQGPPGPYPSGQGPPRFASHPQRPEQGPPRDRPWRPSNPGDPRPFHGPHRDGPPPAGRFGNGPPRREGSSQAPAQQPGWSGNEGPRRSMGNDQAPAQPGRRDEGPPRRSGNDQAPAQHGRRDEGPPRRSGNDQAPAQHGRRDEGPPRREPNGQAASSGRGGNAGPPWREGRGHASPPHGRREDGAPRHGGAFDGPLRNAPGSTPRPRLSSETGQSGSDRVRSDGSPPQPPFKEPPRDAHPPKPDRGSGDNQGQ